MISDAGVAAVVTRVGLAGRLPDTTRPVVHLDADETEWAACPTVPPVRAIGPGHLAYIIYTSGSTGRPKGVMLTHWGLVNHHRAAVSLYGLVPADRALQFCSIGFDASIEEMFPTWAAGATVVFRPEDRPLLGRGWMAWLRDQRISVLNLPTPTGTDGPVTSRPRASGSRTMSASLSSEARRPSARPIAPGPGSAQAGPVDQRLRPDRDHVHVHRLRAATRWVVT